MQDGGAPQADRLCLVTSHQEGSKIRFVLLGAFFALKRMPVILTD
jgi:hypothetical protein